MLFSLSSKFKYTNYELLYIIHNEGKGDKILSIVCFFYRFDNYASIFLPKMSTRKLKMQTIAEAKSSKTMTKAMG